LAGARPCSASTSRPSPTANKPSRCTNSSTNFEGQAAAWDSLGYAHHHLGRHAQAVTCYLHALDLVRDLGNSYPRPPS
jgi:hypothetical protein